MSSASPWWHDLYDDLLAEMLLVRADAAETARTVRFIIDALELAPGDRVFDQCCGIGSLAVELAEAGMDVVGVEQSAAYVERGIEAARQRGLAVRLVHGDARTMTPRPPVRGAFNWWTSFGYGLDDEDNQRMLARAYEALEPGRAFLLDTMNVPGVLRSFEHETVTRRTTPIGDVTLVRQSRLDLNDGVMRKRWSYVLPDGRRVEKQESVVRMYMPDALVRLLRAAGFAVVELFGDLGGARLDLDSPRCICRARKAR